MCGEFSLGTEAHESEWPANAREKESEPSAKVLGQQPHQGVIRGNNRHPMPNVWPSQFLPPYK